MRGLLGVPQRLFLVAMLAASATMAGAQSSGGPRTGAVAGIVTDADGRPVVGAQIAVGSRKATTDRTGTFVVRDLPPKSYPLVVAPPAETNLTGDLFFAGPLSSNRVQVNAGQISRITRVLSPAGRIQVTIESTLPAGSQVPTPTLSIGGGAVFVGEPIVRTGAFVFWGVPPGDNYEVTASAPGFAQQVAKGIVVAAGATTAVSLRFDASSQTGIHGTITTRAGEPIGNLIVFASPEAEPDLESSAKTDSSGSFSIVGLRPGRYSVGALGAPRLGTVTVTEGSQTTMTFIWPE